MSDLSKIYCLYCNICLNFSFPRRVVSLTCNKCDSVYLISRKFSGKFEADGASFDITPELTAHLIFPSEHFAGLITIHNTGVVSVDSLFKSDDFTYFTMHKDDIIKKFSKLKNFI